MTRNLIAKEHPRPQVNQLVTSAANEVTIRLVATNEFVCAVKERVTMLKLVPLEIMASPRSSLQAIKDPDDYMIVKCKDKSS